MVGLEERIREAKLQKKKAREEAKNPSKTKQEGALADLQKKVDILQKAVKTDELKGKKQISESEGVVKALEEERKIMQQRMEYAEQQLQLKDIKIKELRSTVRALQAKFASENQDLSQ